MTLRFGPVPLAYPVLSAPIAGFTDRIFRDIVREFGGCGLIYTEMVSAGGWVQGNIPPDRLNRVEDEARPLGVQLWDREEAPLEEAARRLVDLGITVIDLNFGCPKKRVMGTHAAGAALLRDPATVGRLVAATRRGAGDVPVTAKIRLGATVHARTAPAVARAAADNGAAAVTVHGRTAGDGYGVPCNREMIAEVVATVDVPVIANGDVHDAASALETMRLTGAAGVMVARGALTRPWVFREIAAALAGDQVPAAPSYLEQRALLLRHHAEMIEREGERWGTVAMRKFAVRYLTGTPGARVFRDQITRAETPAEFRETVERFFPLEGPVAVPGAGAVDGISESCDAA